MADYVTISNGQLAVAPEVRSPWMNERKTLYSDYEPVLLEDTETYKMLHGAEKLRKSSLSTVILTVVAIALGLVFSFRVAGIFSINRETKKLTQATEKLSAHLTLEENKTTARQSNRNAADIAAANQMRKIEQGDVVTIENEDTEFTRVYYNGATEETKNDESIVEMIESFLGIVKTK